MKQYRPGEVRGPSPQVIRGTGKLGDIALMQLAWWQAKADVWTILFAFDELDMLHAMCAECMKSIMKVDQFRIPLRLQIQDLTSQTVAHLRQFHRELEDGREDN